MKPERTTEDTVLALLARVGGPLEIGEIAEQLELSKQRVRLVVRDLVAAERLVETPGEPTGAGRPPALFSLPGMEPARRVPGEPYHEPGIYVVMPSGREARVVAMRKGGFCEIEYLLCKPGHEPRTTVSARLLRPIQAGREKPAPFRVAQVSETTEE